MYFFCFTRREPLYRSRTQVGSKLYCLKKVKGVKRATGSPLIRIWVEDVLLSNTYIRFCSLHRRVSIVRVEHLCNHKAYGRGLPIQKMTVVEFGCWWKGLRLRWTTCMIVFALFHVDFEVKKWCRNVGEREKGSNFFRRGISSIVIDYVHVRGSHSQAKTIFSRFISHEKRKINWKMITLPGIILLKTIFTLFSKLEI